MRYGRGRPVTGLELVAAAVVASALGAAAVATSTIALIVSGGLLLAAGTYLSLRDIRWAWCVFFFSICANGASVAVFGLTVRPEYAAAPLFVAALFAHAVREGSVTPTRTLNTAVYVGLGGWVLIGAVSSVLVAPDAAPTLRMLIQLVVALIAFVPLSLARIDLRFFVQSGTVILGAICVGSLIYFALNPSRRVSGLAFEYNIMGCLCVGWVAVLFYFARDRAIVTPRVIAIGVPIALALLLASTRSAWVAAGFILVYWMARNLFSRPLTCIGIVISAILALIVLQDVSDRVGDRDTSLYRVVHIADFGGGTGGYRLSIWADAVTQISDRGVSVLIGSGLNSFSQFNPVDFTNSSAVYLSSLWLGLVYDVGVVGTLFFAVFIVGVFATVDDKWRAVPLFVALATCASITNVVWFAFPWTMIALIVNSSVSEVDSHTDAGAARKVTRSRRPGTGKLRHRRSAAGLP